MLVVTSEINIAYFQFYFILGGGVLYFVLVCIFNNDLVYWLFFYHFQLNHFLHVGSMGSLKMF